MNATVAKPVAPSARFCIGITGHRAAHPGFSDHHPAIASAFDDIFSVIDSAAGERAVGAAIERTRLHTLLADGSDRLAAEMALARGYELVAPLPFGRRLNKTINALPETLADVEVLLAGGEPEDAATRERAAALKALTDRARLFSLADQDEAIRALLIDKFRAPDDFVRAQLFAAECSRRVALAGRILIEQSDLLIAVWDGATTAHVGGTGHTVAAALESGAPVIWIEPSSAPQWRILRAPESLANLAGVEGRNHQAYLRELVRDVLEPEGAPAGSLGRERWHPRSSRLGHSYRRVEALFGGQAGRLRGLTQRYETPDETASGSFAWIRTCLSRLPGVDPVLDAAMTREVLQRFAWMDAVSARLSDSYRGGMIVSFVLSSLAIVGGTAYLPFVAADEKWPFALFELLLLLAILLITFVGTRRRWHGRWFETRRVAEYLRHAPIMLALGAARAPGRWPKGTDTSWPEWHVRQALRAVGLPHMVVTPAYLRGALTGLLEHHVVSQRDYHRIKAERLSNVHHNLDRFSERLFQFAVASVALYLALWGGAALGWIDRELVSHASKGFTVLGVLFPTFGAGVAGIRYFGDFERFSAISEVTAEKLDAVHKRIAFLSGAPDAEIHYGRVAELAHAADDIVVAEIENWQAVFGGKHISVPV